jgi:hypothetical protein
VIDLIVNSEGGITIAHDEERLDAASSFHVRSGTGESWLMLENGEHVELGRVSSLILPNLFQGMKAQSVRMSSEGWSIAKVRDISFQLHNT